MKLVRINGGFGNHMFQYVFGRYIEENSHEEIIFDDTEFFYKENGKRVYTDSADYFIEELFGIKKKRLSEIMDRDVFEYMVDKAYSPETPGEKRRGIIPLFMESGINLFTVSEGDIVTRENQYYNSVYYTSPVNGYSPEVLSFFGDIYYYGYWINAQYFANIAPTLLNELHFPPLTDSKNIKTLNTIRDANERSVAIHVRRGDFVTLGIATDPYFYKDLINKIRTDIEKPVFFVFSDDIPWVKEHYAEFGLLPNDEIIYITGNDGRKNYIDLQLMKECRGMIFANSSFSYFASFLNTRKDKIVLQPTSRQILYYT